MIYNIDAACGSNIGKVRSNNEDNFCFDRVILPCQNTGQTPPLSFYGERKDGECMAVFDGMGGGDHGEVASYVAAKQLNQILSQSNQPENIQDFLVKSTQQLNVAVCKAQEDLRSRRMGSTLAALCFSDDSVYACNLGDSRIFGVREDRMIQISKDHTDESYLNAQGIEGRKPRLTQYLGMDPNDVQIEPYVVKGQLQSGDIYLICSDGLTDMVKPEQIQSIVNANGTSRACVEALINMALANGGRDNVTVIVCRILEQIRPWRVEDDANRNTGSMARLGDSEISWRRKFWSSIRDTAKNAWRKR